MAATAQINLGIIPTPKLSADERDTLLDGLQAALNGAKVTISIRYEKMTKSKPRIEGEDYSSILPPEFLVGEVKKVAVGKNGPYVLLDATLTRDPEGANGKHIGWTSIKGEGVKAVLKVTVKDEEAKKPTTAQ